MSYIQNPEVDGIIAARGGYGVMRLLNNIDFDLIRKNPKIIIGFSDITALLNAIYNETGLITFHGPVASVQFSEITRHSFKSELMNKDIQSKSTFNELLVINEGKASGKICGGNLTMIVSMLGTKYEIDTRGKILMLEEVSEHAYQIDRMLNQLIIAGKIKEAAAVVFGKFKNLNVRKPFFPNRGYTILEVIKQLIKPTGVPAVIGLPFGHTTDKLTLPIGIKAVIDTEKKSFQISEKGVTFE
jgi:muramoyltetrapeptide carboxypeptidase